MNKKDVAERLCEKLPLKKFEAHNFIDLLIETIRERLLKGEKVMLSNFGTFKVVKRERKKVINPNDKKEMFIPARKAVKFTPSGFLVFHE